MKFKRTLILLLLIILLSSMTVFGSNIPLGPYFDDTYFDLSNSALILKVIPHEKGGLEADVSAYSGFPLISGGSTSEIKMKLDATQAPTVNNDIDEGYVVGSVWADITNDKGYLCLDNADGAAVWTEVTLAGSGYTNLTSFVDQTAWRLFYSNADGDIIELPFGTSGQYLKSTGATSAPIYDTPSGAGDMLKATYDTDADGDIDVAAGGTEKSSWTLYAIPYLSGTTAFGEIPIGTAEYALTVNAGANGYDWTLFDLSLYYLKTAIDSQSDMETIWGVSLVTKTGDFTAGRITKINNATGIIEQGTNTDTEVADAVTKKHSQNTDTTFVFTNALASDHTYSGEVDSQPVGESVVFGDLLYFNWTDKEWKKAIASAYATTPAERIALESKTDGQTCLMLVKGHIRDDSAFDFGASRIFLNDDTAGTCDDTAPAESGDQIQIVGTAKSVDILFFNPSLDVGEI